MRHAVAVLTVVMAVSAFASGVAHAGSGFYVSSEMGFNVASEVGTVGGSNDGASYCDEYLNANFADLITSGDCPESQPFVKDWNDTFDGGLGILAGMAAGYSFQNHFPHNPYVRGLRLELEYFFRNSDHEDTATPTFSSGISADKDSTELARVAERIGAISSHNLFGNLYYDFFNNSPFIPYVGGGVGVGFTKADWSSLWQRRFDVTTITTGDSGLPQDGTASDFKQNLAGTSSVANTTLEDVLFGFQVLVGVDYLLTDATSLGLKGRWVKYSTFEDNVIWDPLRGHQPNLRRDGSHPVYGTITTDDIEFFGFSVSLKHHF